MLRLLSATLATTIILAGCSPDTATQATDSIPPVEPPDVTSKDFGNYIVYFNAISTDQLQPEVARAYNIVRSKNRAMLNISIIKKVEGTIGQSVTGDVAVTANNLTGQVKNLVLRQIRDGDANYYIGDVPIANAEVLVFNLSVQPEDEIDRYSVRFSRQFFSD